MGSHGKRKKVLGSCLTLLFPGREEIEGGSGGGGERRDTGVGKGEATLERPRTLARRDLCRRKPTRDFYVACMRPEGVENRSRPRETRDIRVQISRLGLFREIQDFMINGAKDDSSSVHSD